MTVPERDISKGLNKRCSTRSFHAALRNAPQLRPPQKNRGSKLRDLAHAVARLEEAEPSRYFRAIGFTETVELVSGYTRAARALRESSVR